MVAVAQTLVLTPCTLQTTLRLDGVVTQGRRTSSRTTLHLAVLTQTVVTHLFGGTEHLVVIVVPAVVLAPFSVTHGATFAWHPPRGSTDGGVALGGATRHSSTPTLTVLTDVIRTDKLLIVSVQFVVVVTVVTARAAPVEGRVFTGMRLT